jgi:hypothetical protein
MGLLLGWIITIIIEILIISGFVSGGADNAASIIALLVLCTAVAIPIIKATKEKIEESNSYYQTSNHINTSNNSDSTVNQINKSNKSLPTSNHIRRNYSTKVVGVAMDDNGKSNLNGSRQNLIKKLNTGDILNLKHEATNKYDENAIGVFNSENQKLGYISKTINKMILKELSNNNIKDVSVKKITGGYLDKAHGLNIEINFNDSVDDQLYLKNSTEQQIYKRNYSHSTYDHDYDEHDLMHEMEMNARQEALNDLSLEIEMSAHEDALYDLRHEIDLDDYDTHEDIDSYDDYDDYDPF